MTHGGERDGGAGSAHDELLIGMTPAQREATLHTEGPLLILAGPGSGKTRVITRRIAHLLRIGVPAWKILALTFTNKAAAEMRERVERLLLGESSGEAEEREAGERETEGRTGSEASSPHPALSREARERRLATPIAEDAARAGVEARSEASSPHPALSRAARERGLTRGAGGRAGPDEATSTRAAPGEGLQRVARGLTVTTFHSLCARLLRRYLDLAREAGETIPGVGSLTGSYTIYDSADQQALMKRVLADLGLSASNWPPGSVLHTISGAKNKLVDAEGWAQAATDFHAKTISRVFAAYEKALRAANAVDFDDLLMLTVRLLQRSETVRAEVRGRWSHLMIDEYQDTNHAQFVLASLIIGSGTGADGVRAHHLSPETGDILSPGGRKQPNICVVGDPDQSIYGWRGADIGNILEFETNYPGARVISLGENFRSAAPILRVADSLIRKNVRRKHKDLIAARAEPKGGWPTPEIVLCRDERHEAGLVSDWLRARREEGLEWKDMAVAYRTNSLSRVMEEALRASGTAYVVARGTAFYEREEVRDALAYLRVVANQADDVSLSRIVNKPARGIGAATLERVREWARAHGVSLFEGLRTASTAPERIGEITARAAKAMGAFVALVDGWTGGGTFLGAEVGSTLRELVERVVKESGLEKAYSDKGEEPGGEARLENLGELISSAAEFEGKYSAERDVASGEWERAARGEEVAAPPMLAMLRGYLEGVSLVADADKIDPASGAVTLLTLHAAKGLEFGAVAIIGLEEGLLPHSRSRDSEAELEEERRLMFVGVTRAKERLLVTSAKYRTIRGLTERTIPSQFLEELGEVRVSDQTDVWEESGAGESGWGRSLSGGGSRAGASRDEAAFPIGCKVRHPQFGVGKVKEVSGGLDARARVEFPGIGAKTLVLRYARLERVG